MKKLLFFLFSFPSFALASGIYNPNTISSTTLPAGSNNYIQNTNSLQSGATFYVSSGSVNGQFSPVSIKFPDGTIQVSSPISSGMTPGATYYVNVTNTLQSGATFYVSSGTVGTALNLPYLSAGSIHFTGTGGLTTEDNANLFWDDTNNRVGISTGTPLFALDINAANADGLRVGPGITNGERSANIFMYPSSANSGVRNWVFSTFFDARDKLSIRQSSAGGATNPYTSGTTIMALNASGMALGAGAALSGYPAGVIHAATNGTGADCIVERASGDTSSAGFNFRKARGTLSAKTVVTSGDLLGYVDGLGYDSAAYQEAARIDLTSDGTPGAGDMPGRIVFKTTPDGSATLAERMRISNAGDVLISGFTSSVVGLTVKGAASQSSDLQDWQNSSGTNLASVDAGGRIVLNTSTTSATVDGSIWKDTTQKAVQGYVNTVTQTFSGVIFTSTANATVSNTTTETSILGPGIGTKTIPANFLVTGKTIRIRVGGIYSTPLAATPSIIVRLKYGSVVIATVTTTSLLSGASNLEFDGESLFICRATGSSGTVMVHGDIEYATGVAGTIAVDALNNTGATTTINTTTSNALDVTVQWDTNTSTRIVQSTVVTMEVLN